MDRLFGRHGIEIVYRISYALTAAYGFMFLCTLCWPFLHHMFLIIFTMLIVGFLFLFLYGIKSNEFLSGYRHVTRIGSFVYLVLQAIALVDMAFTFHEYFMEKIEQTDVFYLTSFLTNRTVTTTQIRLVAVAINTSPSTFSSPSCSSFFQSLLAFLCMIQSYFIH